MESIGHVEMVSHTGYEIFGVINTGNDAFSNTITIFIHFFTFQALESSKVEGDSQIHMGRFISFLQVKCHCNIYVFLQLLVMSFG